MTNQPLRALCLLFLGGFTAAAQGDPLEPDEPPPLVSLSADVALNFGLLDGFIRIPRAGQPDSSAERRPKLHELGFDRALKTTLDLRVSFADVVLGVRAEHMLLSGSATLKDPLLTQNRQFPAGWVKSRIELTALHVNLGYRFTISLDDGQQLTFTPRFGVLFMHLDYVVKSGEVKADRVFSPSSIEAGLTVGWTLSSLLTLRLDLSASAQDTDHNGRPGLFNGSLTSEWTLADTRPLRATILLGVGFEHLAYEDAQPLPNRIDLNYGPYVSLGLRITF